MYAAIKRCDDDTAIPKWVSNLLSLGPFIALACYVWTWNVQIVLFECF